MLQRATQNRASSRTLRILKVFHASFELIFNPRFKGKGLGPLSHSVCYSKGPQTPLLLNHKSLSLTFAEVLGSMRQQLSTENCFLFCWLVYSLWTSPNWVLTRQKGQRPSLKGLLKSFSLALDPDDLIIPTAPAWPWPPNHLPQVPVWPWRSNHYCKEPQTTEGKSHPDHL